MTMGKAVMPVGKVSMLMGKVTMTIGGIFVPFGSTLSRKGDSTVNVLFLFCIGEGYYGIGEAGEGSGRILTLNCAMLRQRRKQGHEKYGGKDDY